MPKYVNSKSNEDKWKAVKEFTDREEPRKVFWDAFENKKDNKDEINVITYYGIGGIGKSTLLRKLISELEVKYSNAKYAFIDFEKFENYNNNIFEILKYLETNLTFFDLVAYTYEVKMGKNATKPELSSIFDENTELSFLKDVIGEIPLIGTISKVIYFSDRAKNLLQSNLKNNKIKMELQSVDNMTSSEIYDKLPYYFAMDLRNNVEKLDYPFVFFIDTYEKLVNELGSYSALDRDMFLRGDDGLILNVPNVVWVIAGREKLKWAEHDQDWKDSVNQHLLGNLSLTDTAFFLKKAGIPESLINDLYDLTRGAPKYLDICVDTYASLINQNKVPKITDFGKNTVELQKRYLMYMSDIEKDFVTMLAFLPNWTDDNIDDISKSVLGTFSHSLYEKIKELSFIQNDDGVYAINESFKDIIMNNTSEKLRTKYFKLLENYINKEIEEVTAIKETIQDKKVSKKINIDNYASKNSVKNIIFTSIKELSKIGSEKEFVNKAQFIIKKIEEYETKYKERLCFENIDLYLKNIFAFSNTLEYKILLGFEDLELAHVINNYNMAQNPYHIKRFIENCHEKITNINLYNKLVDIVLKTIGKNSLYYAKISIIGGENIHSHDKLEEMFRGAINNYTGEKDSFYVLTVLEGYSIGHFVCKDKLEEVINLLRKHPEFLTVKVLKNILKIDPKRKEERIITFDYIYSIKEVINETLDVNIIDGIYDIVIEHLTNLDNDAKVLEILKLLKDRYEEMYGKDSVKVSESEVYLVKDNVIYNSSLYYEIIHQIAEKYGYNDVKTIRAFNVLTSELNKKMDYLKNFDEGEREYFIGNLQLHGFKIIKNVQTVNDDIREMVNIIYDTLLKFCHITTNIDKKREYIFLTYDLLECTLKYYDDKQVDIYLGCGYFFEFFDKVVDMFASSPEDNPNIVNKLYNGVQRIIIDNGYSNKRLEIILIKIMFVVTYFNAEFLLEGMKRTWGIKNYEWFMETQTDGTLEDLTAKYKKEHYTWRQQVYYILLYKTAKYVLKHANEFYKEYKTASKLRSQGHYDYSITYISKVSALASYVHEITESYKKSDFYYYTWLYTEGLLYFIVGSSSSLPHYFDKHKKIMRKFKKHERISVLEDLYETKNSLASIREVDKNKDWVIYA